LEPGQFFGEGCLNGHPLRIATTSVSLPEDVLTSLKFQDCFASPVLDEKGLGIEAADAEPRER
jgi:hypothetical protein